MADKNLCEQVNKATGGNVVFVINKSDLINSPEQFQNLLEYEKQTLRHYGNSHVGKGRFFNTCCKSKETLDLDGFDLWFNKILSYNNSLILRNIANTVRKEKLLQDKVLALDADIAAAEKEFEKLKTKYERDLAGCKAADHAVLAKCRADIPEYRRKCFEELNSTYEIENAINTLKGKPDFSSKSKAEVQTIYLHRFRAFENNFNSMFSSISFHRNGAVEKLSFPESPDDQDLLSGLTFPGADIQHIESDDGEVAGCVAGIAALAAVITLGIATGGVGLLAGYLVKQAYSETKNLVKKNSAIKTVDNSTATTMAFIKKNVFPIVSSELDRIFSVIDERIKYLESTSGQGQYPRKLTELSERITVLRMCVPESKRNFPA
jgi:hypothetical protein